MVERVATTGFTARSGAEWQAHVFRDKATGAEQWQWSTASSTPTSRCWSAFTASTCSPTCSARRSERSGLLQGAMAMIEPKAPASSSRLHAASPGSLSRATRPAFGHKPSRSGDGRRGVAQLRHRRADLAALGIHDMILLSKTAHSPVALAGYGLATSRNGRSPGR